MTEMEDRGAHFFRCDFQVHTPRDARWSGALAVTAEERSAYAKELIKACREKGLDAIAITDHHDFVMFPYIRNAALSEKDWLGDSVPDRRQIVVFPGLELSLAAPTCQVILILDANFPDNLLASVLTALAITPAPDSDKRHAKIERIPLTVVRDLKDLQENLNNHTHLRGRFIVLPNVSDSGSHTLLRSGFADFYRTMPCVGGYVDGLISELGTGNRDILSGRNSDYGNRRLAVFQTSDSRSRDHCDLGIASTWVKWATPSAEALRQACLGQDSRISQEPPELPAVVIRSLHVSNSHFLGPVDLYLNPQYTALIGSRGTGKTTILEYLRWGLCDEQRADPNEAGTEGIGVRQQRLVENTLKKVGATVEVKFEVNGVPHLVRRRSESGEVLLRIGESELRPCSQEEIRGLLPVEAYSQKQLSRVGHRVDDLDQFVRSGIKTELDSIDREARTLVSESREIYAVLRRKQTVEKALREDRLALESLSQQAKSIRDSLTGLSPAQQELLSRQPLYLSADIQVEKWDSELREINAAVVELLSKLATIPSEPKFTIDSHPESETLLEIRNLIRAHATAIRGLGSQMSADLGKLFDAAGAPSGAYAEVRNRWASANQAFSELYDGAKGAASSHQTQLSALAELEQKIRVITQRIETAEGELNRFGDPESAFRKVRTDWKSLHRRKGDLYVEQCRQLTELSEGIIRATARRGANVKALGEQMRGITKGSGLRTQKIDEMLARICAAEDPVALWDNVLEDCERLAVYTPGSQGDARPASPWLVECGFGEGDLTRLAERITPENWIELALAALDDETTFEYRTREQEYIAFENASAGQQATALLIALLNQAGRPLIIDQPEDDLDNQIMFDIARRLCKAKTGRQLIFSSHNANLVVNGDAELVVWCDNRVAGDYSGGRIAGEGAIDMPGIRDAIKAIMEGGEKAFKLRLEKYGF